MTRFWSVPAMVLLLAGSPTASAAQWTQIGPDGGRVGNIENDPVTVTTSYAATSAGLYRTTDGGDHWTLLGAGLFLGAPAISAANPSVLYATGGTLTDGGVFKSSDGGASWTRVLVTTNSPKRVVSLAIDPTNPSVVYAATDSDGRHTTIDGGATWVHSDSGIVDNSPFPSGTAMTFVAVHPQTPSTVYAGAGGTGLWKSTDAGATWAQSNGGLTLPTSLPFVLFDPQTPSTMYTQSGGLKKSVDGGATWTPLPSIGLPASPAIWTLALDPTTPSTLYVWEGSAASARRLYVSLDGGDHWAPPGCGDFHANDIAVRTDGVLLVAGTNNSLTVRQGGVYRSTDGGATCPKASSGLSAFSVAAVAAAGTLYMGDSDTGVYRTTDGGASWTGPLGGLTSINRLVHDIVVDRTNPSTVYHTAGNLLNDNVWRSVDAGDSWTNVHGPLFAIESLAIDPTAADHVVVGRSGFVSSDPLEPPVSVPGSLDQTIDGGGAWTTYSTAPATIQAVAFAPGDPSIVYAALNNSVLKSVDGGVTFPTGSIAAPDGQPVIDLAVDSSNSSIVYALTVKFFGSDPPGVVFKSVDGGATWGPRNVGIEGLFSEALALDPASPTTLYLATSSKGVFRSTNGAATWAPVNDGLTTLFTQSIAVDPTVPGRVYVGTAGSSVFTRDFPVIPPCVADGDPCNDDDPCTVNDACSGGVCLGTTPTCGDGVVAGCEICDAGAANGTPASCCAATCQLVAPGTACADDGDLCSSDRCDAAGTCIHPTEHDPLCVAPTTRGASLKVVDKIGTGTDQVAFKWAKGPAVSKNDFGAPNGATAYALCVYDRTTGGDVLAYRGRALPPCTKSPCWTESSTGWKFNSPGGPDGVRTAVLKSGTVGRAKLQVKAKRAGLALAPLPFAKSPSVVAEVRSSDGACWGATFSTPQKSTSERFTARSD